MISEQPPFRAARAADSVYTEVSLVGMCMKWLQNKSHLMPKVKWLLDLGVHVCVWIGISG